MATPDPRALVESFAQAISRGDGAAAEACCAPEAWSAAHGDSPARLFRKAADPERGVSLSVVDDLGGEVGRSAVEVALHRGDRQVGRVQLLVAPEGIVGVSETPEWSGAFVAGVAPALLDYERLPEHVEAAEALVALASLARLSSQGDAEAAEAVSELMNAAPEGSRVVARLQHAVSRGAWLQVHEGRHLPGLGRAVVRADLIAPDRSGSLERWWCVAELGPPLVWLSAERTLRKAAVVG